MRLVLEETLEDDCLDPDRWLTDLPAGVAAARYQVGGGALRLLTEADEQPWRPDLDGGLRVSSCRPERSRGHSKAPLTTSAATAGPR
jgi:hypothetical protein